MGTWQRGQGDQKEGKRMKYEIRVKGQAYRCFADEKIQQDLFKRLAEGAWRAG